MQLYADQEVIDLLSNQVANLYVLAKNTQVQADRIKADLEATEKLLAVAVKNKHDSEAR